MKGRALLVPLERGEETRRTLRAAGLLRGDLKIRNDGERLAFPLIDGMPVPDGLGEVGEREFEVSAASGPTDYRDLVSGTDAERALLPRSFDVVGDVVLVRIPPELDARAAEIGAALLRFVPGARVVGRDRGVHGAERRRSLERIAGSGTWRTRHRENGIELEVDLERAYFSPRLAREHALVAEEIALGDRVYDLCCGVGPFAATIARDGRAVALSAVDSNPFAIDLLRTTLGRVPHGDRVAAIEQDVEGFARDARPVERVILNLPREGIKYLPSVARTVAPRGRLYYYEVTPRTEQERRGQEVIRVLGPSNRWAVAGHHVVHPYSPDSDLVAFVFERIVAE
jgi:tRNA (guanine37-N1)-methyltransferase